MRYFGPSLDISSYLIIAKEDDISLMRPSKYTARSGLLPVSSSRELHWVLGCFVACFTLSWVTWQNIELYFLIKILPYRIKIFSFTDNRKIFDPGEVTWFVLFFYINYFDLYFWLYITGNLHPICYTASVSSPFKFWIPQTTNPPGLGCSEQG